MREIVLHLRYRKTNTNWYKISLHPLQSSSQSGSWNFFRLILPFLASHVTNFFVFLKHVQFPWNKISFRWMDNFYSLKTSAQVTLLQGVFFIPHPLLCSNIKLLGIYFTVSQIMLNCFHFSSGQYHFHFEFLGQQSGAQ